MGDIPIPILKDTKDPHYRYKMPKLTAKVEGSGNGIKTVITNMQAIARALGRPPSYPTKYFGCELGAQVTMNQDLYVVNGSHDPEKLLNLLYAFIRKFVLCGKCNNPETSLIVSTQLIKQKCIACGHEAVIPNTIHKLTTYIRNHPPDGSNPTLNGVSASGSAATPAGDKKSKSSKKSSKNGKDSANANTSPNGTANAYDNNNNMDDNDFGDDGFDDDELTAEAYLERQRELCDGLPSSGKYDAKEHANIFFKLLKEKKDSNQLTDGKVHIELVKEAERLEIKDKSTLVLTELLLTKENILNDIKTYRMLFLRFCHENQKAQKYLLGGYEKLVGEVYKDELFNDSMKILKKFYDEDILDEEAIIEWSKKPSKKYISKEMSKKIHEKVEPFIKWLKEAEVDSEDQDDQKPAKNGNGKNGGSNEDDESNDDDEEEDKKKKQQQSPKTGVANTKGVKQTASGAAQPERKQSLEDDEDEDEDFLEFSHRVSGIKLVDATSSAGNNLAGNSGNSVNQQKGVTNGGSDDVDDLDIDNI